MDYYSYYAANDYLAHHGVLGMKWGQHIFGKQSVGATKGRKKKNSTNTDLMKKAAKTAVVSAATTVGINFTLRAVSAATGIPVSLPLTAITSAGWNAGKTIYMNMDRNVKVSSIKSRR